LPGLIGIPITPTISQEIGVVWKKGKYITDSVEKYISFTKKFHMVLCQDLVQVKMRFSSS
jgi:hypothetical protein